jgi:cytochrome c oxidase subunit 2
MQSAAADPTETEAGMYQDIAWYVTVVLVIVVALGFIFVARRASDGSGYEPIQSKSALTRTVVFWALVLVSAAAIVASLAHLPYAAYARGAGAAEVIQASGHQWRWELSKNQVVAGKPVEFHVTGADVNHGFAIYDPQLRLVAQTQAMPGYTNVLRVTFTHPGAYRVMCLEYCGLAHHSMMAELTVLASE